MKLPPRPIFFIAAATALSLLGDAMLYAVLPIHYTEIGLIPLHVGLLLSANRWVRLITNHLAERCYRRGSIGLLVALAFLVGAGMSAVYGAVRLFAVLLLARIVWGVCWSFIRQAGVMMVVDGASENRLGERMGYYNGIVRLGGIGGLVLGGLGRDHFGFAPTLIVFSLVSALAAPLGLLSRKGLAHTERTSATGKGDGGRNPGLLLCGFVIGTVGSGLLVSTLGRVLRQEVGTSVAISGYTIGVATLAGAILGISRLSNTLGSPIMGALSDRLGSARAVPIFFGAGALVIAFATVLGPVFLVAAVLVFSVCDATLRILLSAEAGRLGARSIASYVTAGDLGAAIGPLVGWGLLPTHMVFLTGGILYAIGAIFAVRMFGYGRRQTVEGRKVKGEG